MRKIYFESIACIEEESVFDTLINKVNKSRQKKVRGCKQQKDKQRSLLAGLLLRQALEEAGLDYERLEFSVLESGKPYLVSHPDIHFSISHAGDYVVCVTSDNPIGVDIEYIGKPIFHKEKGHCLTVMAKKCLSLLEWEHFLKSEAPAQFFLECWTKKEAYSKCIGKGLGMDFATIDTETQKQGFSSVWFCDEYCISVYEADATLEEYVIEKEKMYRGNFIKNR